MEVANRLCELYYKYNGLSRFLFVDVSNISFGSGKIIPYFNQDNYYRLQSILLGRDLPTFYLSDLAKLPWQLFDKSYDIILTSNIFYSLYLENEKRHIQEYKEILEKFHFEEIQALYCWSLEKSLEIEFERNGFDIERVHSARKLKLFDDTVISLRKKK